MSTTPDDDDLVWVLCVTCGMAHYGRRYLIAKHLAECKGKPDEPR